MSSAQKKRKSTPETTTSPLKDTTDPKTPSNTPKMLAVHTSEKSGKKSKRPQLSVQHSELDLRLEALQVQEERMEGLDDPNADSLGPSTPLPAKKDKGKGKALPVLETPDEILTEDAEQEAGDDSGSELSDIGFLPLNVEADMVYANKDSKSLIHSFTAPPDLYFKDHMAPYRGIMKESKNEPET